MHNITFYYMRSVVCKLPTCKCVLGDIMTIISASSVIYNSQLPLSLCLFICQVVDKRNVYFKDRLNEVFQGHGQMLGGETKPSRLLPSNLDKSQQYEDESQLPGDEFIRRVLETCR